MSPNTNVLDLETLEQISEYTIQNDCAFQYYNEYTFLCLKESALEIHDDEKQIYVQLKKKYLALKCLHTLFFNKLSTDFCIEFIDRLSDVILMPEVAVEKIKEYVSYNDLNDKLCLLKILTLCFSKNKVNFSVFENNLSTEWCKELLLYVIFSNLDADAVTMQQTFTKIDNIENLVPQLSVKVLDYFIWNTHSIRYDFYLLNDILYLVCKNPNFILSLPSNMKEVKNEINDIKRIMLGPRLELSDFKNKMLSNFVDKYPFEVIDVLGSENDLNELFNFVSVLNLWQNELRDRVKFMLKLNANETLTKWKHEVAFQIVKDILSKVFLAYDNKYQQKEAINTFECMVTTTSVKCTCLHSTKICSLHDTDLCYNLLYCLNTTIARVIFDCSNPSQTVIDVIEIIVNNIKNEHNIIEWINALDTIFEYNIQFPDRELYKFFAELKNESNYERKIHEYAVEHSFPGSYEKSIDELIEEINPEVKDTVITQFIEIKNKFKSKSVLYPNCSTIKLWDECQIQKWAIRVRFSNPADVSDEEMVAVIIRASEVAVKLKLRDVQLLTVLTMISSCEGKGRLAQVNTGEGKTLIIAVLAAYCVLKGNKVDICTSSPLLAIPQVQEFQHFYKICAIYVTHNIDVSNKLPQFPILIITQSETVQELLGLCNLPVQHNILTCSPSSIYEHDVIYGTNHSFQRDLLRDEFRKSGIRKNRGFDIVIVDEVDNMLIDGNGTILKLSCDMPGMDYLEVLLAAIFIQVKEAAGLLVEKDGQLYYLSHENAIGEDGNVNQQNVHEIPIDMSITDFIFQCTEAHIRKLIRDENDQNQIEDNYPEIKVPIHLREVICKIHLKKWILSAIRAIFNYIQDEDYIVKDGKITIVDVENTGVIKKNSHWCSGLHQFLEIKHGAKVQPESLTSNYISNVGLFMRYTTKIFGLTGTLGSNETKKFLQNVYNVDSVIIPPFKRKQHQQLNAVLINDQNNKYKEIAKSCIRKLKNGRAVLVIMKYIKETDILADVLIKTFQYSSSKVKLFKTDYDASIITEPLKPGEIIITTNIAGRGTDIKLSRDVEKNGGLHVCLTFLPINSRVEHQNIGRTSRKGNRGTSQFVLCDENNTDIHVLQKKRQENEKRVMAGALETVRKIKTKDNLFREFCRILDQIKGRNFSTKKIEQEAVEERFAIWLLYNEDNINNDKKISDNFDDFKKNILRDDGNNKLIKNSFMYIKLGNNYMKKNLLDEAISEYTSSIITDEHFAEHAHYNRAWAYIKKYGSNSKKNAYFIDEAINDLKMTRKLIKEKEYGLHLLQTASRGEVFSEQISHKLNLYSIQKNTIDLAIGPDIIELNKELNKMEILIKDNNLSSEERDNIQKYIKSLEENKKEIGVIGRAKKNKRNITIESLGNDFMEQSDRERHKDEISEFENNGWIGGFKISEIKPIEWTTVISLLCIGLGQLIVGAALAVFTLGAGASIGMGFISEGVSDIITAIKDGIINREFDWATWALMKVISVAVSIVCAGFKAIKDAASTAYSGAKNIVITGTKTFTEVSKQGWKLVAKKIGVELSKGIAKEIVTDLITYGVDKMCIPMIEDIIIEMVRDPIQEALIENQKVMQMLKIDEKNKNHSFESQIKNEALKLLLPENNSKLKTLALQIVHKIEDSNGLALTRQVLTGITGLCEVADFVTYFLRKMEKTIDGITIDEAESSKHIENVRNDTTNCSIEEEQQSFDNKRDDDIDLNKLGIKQEEVKHIEKIHTTDVLSEQISGMVSTNMVNIIKGKIISPIIQAGASYTVDNVSEKVNSNLNKSIENFRSLKNVIHYQNKGYSEKSKPSNNADGSQKVDKIITDLKEGGPAGLVHLGAISDATERPIEVYNEKGKLMFVIGDTKKTKPLQIQYHTPENGNIGHFTLKDGRDPKEKSTKNNMCLFDVVSEQTGVNPNELKNKTLSIMERGKDVIGKQLHYINRLEMYDRHSLVSGGAQYNGKNPDDAKIFLRNSNGIFGFKNDNVPGHADIHVPFQGKTVDRLNAIADETGRPVHVYDEKGNLSYVIGENDKAKPIELEYHKPDGDTSGEYFSSKGGNEKYVFHGPDDHIFSEIVSKQTKSDASKLEAATNKRMQDQAIPSAPCIENETKKKRKTGFISEEEGAYVFHYAMQTEVAKENLAKMNEYTEDVNNTEEYYKRSVHISAEDLKLPRPAYGGWWQKGKLRVKWPVKDVQIVFQHFNGEQCNRDAAVQIQTIYPIAAVPPPAPAVPPPVPAVPPANSPSPPKPQSPPS